MLAHLLCAEGRYDEADRYGVIGQSAAALDDYEAQSSRSLHAQRR
jgi:hypothetical protein